MPKKKMRCRRVTIERDADNKFIYRAQGGNWAEIDRAEQGFVQKASVHKRIASRWPNAEEVLDRS